MLLPAVTNEKAYVLGLLVGGGELSSSTFKVNLPFAQWGMNPRRMSSLARDILTRISERFQKAYGLDVVYEIGNNKWYIVPASTPDMHAIQRDLSALGLPTIGFPLNSADLNQAKKLLKGTQVEYFLSGVFDARASLAKSHRRFTDEAPVVSIEVPGRTQNFKFVVQLCSWLTDLGSITDQILYNHPCQHSPADPTYRNWKKGFKIRFLAKTFLESYSFALQAKAKAARKLEAGQKKNPQVRCEERKPHSVSPVSIHDDINSADLPIEVRGKLFFHYHHICASLGCPHAPKKHIEKLVRDYKSYVFVFTRITKGRYSVLKDSYDSLRKKYFPGVSSNVVSLTCSQLVNDKFKSDSYNEIETAAAYLLSTSLRGKRHKGPKAKILLKYARNMLNVEHLPSVSESPILVWNKANGRAVIVTSQKGKANADAIGKAVSVKGIDVRVA